MSKQWVEQQRALEEVVERALAEGVVALDTEFVWERTYVPDLGLIQMGFGNRDAALVDPLAVTELSSLRRLMGTREVVKLLHDAQQDITIIRRAVGGGSVAGIFDTRIAAGFVGLGATLSLEALLSEVLGVAVEKGETRSNWLARPLREEQEAYAAEDVRYLVEAREVLLERVRARGREAWLEEEMAKFEDEGLYVDRDPQEAFRRVKGAGKLKGQGAAVLRSLAAWREEEARRRNKPRGFVLTDELLVQVALTRPRQEADLRRFKAAGVRRNRAALVAAVGGGLACPQRDWPRRSGRYESGLDKKVKPVMERLRAWCEEHELDATLVAPRATVKHLVSLEEPLAEVSGWRREVLEQVL